MDASNERQRVQRRLEAAVPIRVLGMDAGGGEFDEPATALEVSRRGLSFLSSHELPVLSTLTVAVPGLGAGRATGGSSDFSAEATVIRCAKDGEASYRVTIRFMGATLPLYSREGL